MSFMRPCLDDLKLEPSSAKLIFLPSSIFCLSHLFPRSPNKHYLGSSVSLGSATTNSSVNRCSVDLGHSVFFGPNRMEVFGHGGQAQHLPCPVEWRKSKGHRMLQVPIGDVHGRSSFSLTG